ncbi:MAG: hypothetical protein JNM03_10525 [Sphingopyxis sp.]|uniref:hypothetical protein n=1 Tax=Sphingopyxis sp. TaxID=1908224 RepID=UPI001A3B71F8|nr:hypothetical protein [Sphingopyxis sp.]MBL9070412.1 hypothetical protein [Sphingopyxis sp.]
MALMPTRKTRNTALALIPQVSRGTFVDPAANLMPISNLTDNIESVTVQNSEYTGSIDQNGDEVVGKQVTISFDVNLRGPGGADVPSAGAYLPGILLVNAKMTEVITATAIPAAPEALSAGSTTGFTGGAGMTGTLDLYKGMLVRLLGVSTSLAGVSAIRTNSASKVVELCETFGSTLTGNYQIPKQLAYVNSISSTDPLPLSLKVWIGGKRYDLVDCQVTSAIVAVQTSTSKQGSIPVLRFSLAAIIYNTADEDTPAIPSLGTTPKFKNGKQFVAKKALGGSGFELNFGLQTDAAPNPNQTTGDEGDELVGKQITLTPNLLSYRKADFDQMALADAQSQHPYFALWGETPGQIVSVIVPDGRFKHAGDDMGGTHVTQAPQMLIDVKTKGVVIAFPYY